MVHNTDQPVTTPVARKVVGRFSFHHRGLPRGTAMEFALLECGHTVEHQIFEKSPPAEFPCEQCLIIRTHFPNYFPSHFITPKL